MGQRKHNIRVEYTNVKGLQKWVGKRVKFSRTTYYANGKKLENKRVVSHEGVVVDMYYTINESGFYSRVYKNLQFRILCEDGKKRSVSGGLTII